MRQITIFLGNNCNANCSYCHSSKVPDQFKEISPLFLEWLQKQDELKIVKFLGGEPTLYLDKISTIIETCNKNVEYVLMTNGLLLKDNNVINFLNDNKILTVISFDGMRGSRGYDDVFFRDDYIVNLGRIHKLGAAATLSATNCDIEAVQRSYADIENKLSRYLPLFSHPVHVTSEDIAPFGFSDKQYDDYLSYKKDRILTIIDNFDNGVFNLKLSHFLKDILYQNNYLLDETKCYNRNHILFDINGDNYMCGYNRDINIGTLGSEESFKRQKEILDEKFPQCQICEYRSTCGIACHKSIKLESECNHFKRYAEFINSPEIKSKLEVILKYMDDNPIVMKTGAFFNL